MRIISPRTVSRAARALRETEREQLALLPTPQPRAPTPLLVPEPRIDTAGLAQVAYRVPVFVPSWTFIPYPCLPSPPPPHLNPSPALRESKREPESENSESSPPPSPPNPAVVRPPVLVAW
ncbi:hypothetical protein FA13DRAFT_1747523 [Coprinellus micaceus]|uniref:Uncharacterized protein n=1 Tax=Coprinellus micaceus TaxID=71717 RepID=A0A4Y7S341_COPMI|nr:hypothetical protein FA13DRAFT_1747523 [Coprinellus micaceus]